MAWLAPLTVALAGFYFLGLGVLAVWRPGLASRYLLGFATTPAKHVLEMGIRLWIGWGLYAFAPLSPWPAAFIGFGTLLLLTSVALLLVPWRLHRGFAAWAVPQALPFIQWIAASSLLMGLALLFAVLRALG